MVFDVILLDMDGVLADFHGSALKLLGRDPAVHEFELGNWEIYGALGLTEDEFWEKIDSNPDFWDTLEPTPWMNDLIRIAERRAKEWYVCSSPSRNPASVEGKVRWLYKHIRPRFREYIFTKHKHLLAKPKVVLIDDADHNVDAFDEAGGLGLLLPQPWNSQWVNMDEDKVTGVQRTLDYLEKMS